MSNANTQNAHKGQRTNEVRKLSELKPFPLQEQLAGTTTDVEDAELARDIEQNGLKEAIHVLPKNKAGLPINSILDGHRRSAALRLLKHDVVTVVVRHDLADDDREAIDREFLTVNLMRRQLSPLAKARLAKRLLETNKEANRLQSGEVRDRVGKLVGMCGRNLDRHWAVLKTPLEVQSAFESKKLTLIEAERISRLDESKRRQIARRIAQGDQPRRVAADFLRAKRGTHVKPNDAFAALIKTLQRGRNDLSDRVAHVSPKLIAAHQSELRRARRLLGDLLDRRLMTVEEESAGW